MKIEDVRKIIEGSTGNSLVRVTVPSTGKQMLFKPMTVGMKKSVAKFSLNDSSDEAGVEFQIAKLALIQALCPEIDVDTLTDVDFIAILCNIRMNSSMEPLKLSIKCDAKVADGVDGNGKHKTKKCGEAFEHSVNFASIIDNCMKFEFKQVEKVVKIDDAITITMTLTNPRIKDILELEKYLLTVDDETARLRDRIIHSPYLHITGLKVNGENVEDFTTHGLFERIDVLDGLGSAAMFDGKDGSSVFNEIRGMFSPDDYRIFEEVKCPKCGNTREGVFSTDSFFTI